MKSMAFPVCYVQNLGITKFKAGAQYVPDIIPYWKCKFSSFDQSVSILKWSRKWKPVSEKEMDPLSSINMLIT